MSYKDRRVWLCFIVLVKHCSGISPDTMRHTLSTYFEHQVCQLDSLIHADSMEEGWRFTDS